MGRRKHQRCLKRIAELERELGIAGTAAVNPFYVISETVMLRWSTDSSEALVRVDVPRFKATPFTMPPMGEL